MSAKSIQARDEAAELLGFTDGRHYLNDNWPDRLNIEAIAILQGDSKITAKRLKKQIESNVIPRSYEPTDYLAALNPTISANDFILFLKALGREPSEHIKAWALAVNEIEGIIDNNQDHLILSDTSTDIENPKTEILNKKDRRLAFIISEITKQGWDLLTIPDGGKAIIKKICLKNGNDFTDSSFNEAWVHGNKTGKISLQNKDKYIP